jgi:hypothetical protein
MTVSSPADVPQLLGETLVALKSGSMMLRSLMNSRFQLITVVTLELSIAEIWTPRSKQKQMVR